MCETRKAAEPHQDERCQEECFQPRFRASSPLADCVPKKNAQNAVPKDRENAQPTNLPKLPTFGRSTTGPASSRGTVNTGVVSDLNLAFDSTRDNPAAPMRKKASGMNPRRINFGKLRSSTASWGSLGLT